MASDVDGIILNADMNNELIEEINAADAQGIPVVCIGTENYGSDRKTFIAYIQLCARSGIRKADCRSG